MAENKKDKKSELKMAVKTKDLGGGFPIQNALELQDDLWAKRTYGNADDILMFAEHEPVYTVGTRASLNLDLLQKCFKKPLLELPCPYLITRRGGLATYQGPGILSVYCIFKIPNFNPEKFNDMLLDSAEEVMKFFDVSSRRSKKNPGLYIGADKKILSVGLKYSRGVTRFGMALSVDPDPVYLLPLIPCGIEGVRLTTLRDEIGREITDLEKMTIKVILSEKIKELHKN